MARQRRGGGGGGFRPPELRGTLGTLLRTTLAQAGVVRDVLERGAREGRSRLDDARASRRRSDALAELGEAILDLIRRGEIDLDELPEVRDLVAHLDELDAGHPDTHVEPPSSVRSRFDTRTQNKDKGDGTVSSGARIWRPPADPPVAERKGGITFDEPEADDDLADYMHPDDVPPKPKG